MAKIIPDDINYGLIETDDNDEIFKVRLECIYPGCTECEKTAFTIVDDKGKIKIKTKDKIKEDFYKEKDIKNMPNYTVPANWYCNKHADMHE